MGMVFFTCGSKRTCCSESDPREVTLLLDCNLDGSFKGWIIPPLKSLSEEREGGC